MGRIEKISNLIFATGHGMLGVTQGPATGKLVSDIVTEQPTTLDLASFRPERY
ncbi:MAG: hypothetical protein AAF902_21750 [Chloroflexota bacterium]